MGFPQYVTEMLLPTSSPLMSCFPLTVTNAQVSLHLRVPGTYMYMKKINSKIAIQMKEQHTHILNEVYKHHRITKIFTKFSTFPIKQ